MAADTHIWTHGNDVDDEQITFFTPTAVANNEIYKITLSDDNSFSYQITFTSTGDVEKTVVDGLVAAAVAAKAAGIQPWSNVTTTNDSDTDVVVTGDADGYVVYWQLDISSQTAGDFAYNSTGSQVARSNNDFGLPANWHNNEVPVAGDTIVIPSTATADITKNLRYLGGINTDDGGSAAEILILDFEIEEGCTIQIGTVGESLLIPQAVAAAKTLHLNGTGQKWLEFDITNQNLVFIIREAGSTSGGSMGTNISFDCGTGTATADITLTSGQSVGFGALERESYDSLTDIEIKGAGKVVFGSGYNGTATLPDADGVMDIGAGSVVDAYSAVLTANIEGTLRLYDDITTANIFGGRCYRLAPTGGVAGTFNLYQGGRMTFGPAAPAPTALHCYGGQWIIDDEFGKTSGVAWQLHGCRPTDGIMNGPKNLKWTPAAIT